jgi:hypothetical protein
MENIVGLNNAQVGCVLVDLLLLQRWTQLTHGLDLTPDGLGLTTNIILLYFSLFFWIPILSFFCFLWHFCQLFNLVDFH